MWRRCATALRAVRGPALVLQALAFTVVAAYFLWPPARAALDTVAGLKERLGLGFSAVVTCVCGGLVPFLLLRRLPATRAVTPAAHIWFYLPLMLYRGVEIDLFYTFQTQLFGPGNDPATLAAKVFFDQLGFTPFWALPTSLWLYGWRDANFDPRALGWRALAARLRRDYWPSVFSNWVVWFPAVTAVYAMPAALQVPLFALVLCFWSLLLLTLTRRDAA